MDASGASRRAAPRQARCPRWRRSAVAAAGFDDEISSIAHRLRDALTAAGLLVLVQINQDVQLVARSSNRAVDVSVIARELGGGGHSRAAAALIVGQPLAEVVTRVHNLLPRAVKPMTTVGQLMSYGVQTKLTSAEETTIRQKRPPTIRLRDRIMSGS